MELNGEEIADSDIIIKQLSAKFEKDNPSANLADEQKNIQHAMVTMVENHLQWSANSEYYLKKFDSKK